MSDLLVRVPLSNQSDFHPLALAPGLPMLDARKLTYQVLLGWFGDLLAEPELDENGVSFHVQRGGQREEIVEKALATDADLEGPLAGDFERLKKALFDVKPESPSERLIFNRLQPPIGNYDGYLYRVRTQSGPERLVWCWGFQCRNTDARASVCPNRECSALLLQVGEELESCPQCRFTMSSTPPVRRRTRFPLGAFTAATVLLLACGATIWVAASRGTDLEDIPGLAMLEDAGLNIPRPLSAAEDVAVDEPIEAADPEADSADSPPSIILPDPTAEPVDVAATEAGSPIEQQPEQPGAEAPTTPDSRPAQLSGRLEAPEGERQPEPATTVGTLTWHQDYQTAYQQATEQKRRLLVVFRDTVDPDSINSPSVGLAGPELTPLLKDFVRLALPANMTIPGQEGGTLLLEHRAFRHLNVQPGIVIVDLTDPESSWYGRVVSALPQPPSGRYSAELVRPLLELPPGTVTHRTLLLALQNANPESQFATGESEGVLNQLADRNCRFMTQYGQAGLFDAEYRQSVIASQFGSTAVVRELTFATDDTRTIQDAAILAVESWVSDPDSFRMLNGAIDAYGLEMFQGPDSGRWFVTLLVVIQP